MNTKINILATNGSRGKKTCLWEFVKNKGVYQPVHLGILISAFNFVIPLLESIKSKLATSVILLF